MDNLYPIIKSLHIISVISWMAGMLYLPRLFVYHVDAFRGGELDKTLQIMEKRLLRFIINPAMILSFIFGIWLIHFVGFSGGWLHLKIVLVLIMTWFHVRLARWRKDFEIGQNKHTEKFYRIANEVPTLLMIAIVFLVVLKPF